MAPRAGAAAVVVSRVRIDKGVITYVAHGKGPAETPYRVEDLDVTVVGQGTQLAFNGAFVVRPGDLTVKLADGMVATNGAKTLVEASVRAKIAIEAKDIEKLVAAAAGPTPTIAGPIKGDFALGGTLGVPRMSGNVELASVRVTRMSPACPEPKQRTLALGLLKVGGATWDGARFQSRPVTTSVGGGPISTNLTLTLDHGARVQLSDLAIKSVPAEKVLVDFLCEGYAVSGPLDLTGALSTNTSDLLNTLGGSGQLRIGPGKVVGPQALALISVVTQVAGAASSVLAADVPQIAHDVTRRLRVDHRQLPDHERRSQHEGPPVPNQGGESGCRGGLRRRDRAHEPRPARRSRTGRDSGEGHRERRLAVGAHRSVVPRR